MSKYMPTVIMIRRQYKSTTAIEVLYNVTGTKCIVYHIWAFSTNRNFYLIFFLSLEVLVI